ncbi:hypothetical protein M2226_009570 [Bradyrhizobium elkanii]|nr:hypothetical protein [Bradyrhizobium elkanii]MCW2175927.1 hypothetical protein [Bradyrhizobium elkanii]
MRGHILVHHAVGNVGLNQQRLRIRSWERSRNSSSESPARRVRAVHSYREEQSGKRNWDHARCCGTVARGSSRECAETACGLRERRHGGASRAVPGGARPNNQCCITYWMIIVSWVLGVLGFLLLLTDIVGIWRAISAYRILVVALIAQAIMSSLLLPDPRKDWIEPVITTELTALCALERQRAFGAKALDPATDQPILSDNRILQAVRKTCQSLQNGAADR